MAPEEDEEQIEEKAEIEKQPLELDEILELFRGDEEPGYRSFNPMWLVLALIVIVGGCWLASVGVGVFVEKMNSLQGGGPKAAKSADRASETERVPDVAAAFRERCKKGMSRDEVRWILEDFEKAAVVEEREPLKAIIFRMMHRESGKEASAGERDLVKNATLDRAKRERKWYADALAEGLLLDAYQKAEMNQKLVAAFAADTTKFEEVDADRIGEWLDFTLYFSIAEPERWLRSYAYAPWNLCQLSADQLAVTNYDHVSAQQDENAAAGWLSGARPWLQVLETKDKEGHQLIIPSLLGEAAGIFPLTEDQMNNAQFGPLNFMDLHPAQLKLALLVHPELANDLRHMVEAK